MKVFILGNGFDLQHHFPTKYINFLNVVNFLIKNYNSEKMNTVGDVLSSSRLHEKDKWIGECYLEHESIYNITTLEQDKVKMLTDGAKENCWFKYFSTCFDQDKGWIDFEKGIADVIEAFRSLFDHITPIFVFMSMKDRKKEYICSKFDFYYDLINSTYLNGASREQTKEVKKEYCIEKLSGSKIIEVDKQKIISKLYKELRNFAELLQLYLEIFVELPLRTMKEQKFFPLETVYSSADRVISFNYTSTFTQLYSLPQNHIVGHIHGTVYKDIVLGVNPDKYDEIADLDTAFIQFKKYYQRVFLNADDTYLYTLEEFNNVGYLIHLRISGHSLDTTDSDIIKEWIERAYTVGIYYHDENAVGGYIENLVATFGKDEFDKIRINKQLKFIKNPIINFAKRG